MSFDSLGLEPEIRKAVSDAGYTDATDVQAHAIPAALAGRDLMVSSHTGSGKTAAFVLPALQRMLAARRDPAKRREQGHRAWPARAGAGADARAGACRSPRPPCVYGRRVPGLRVASVVGGVPYGAQLKALRGPLDILSPRRAACSTTWAAARRCSPTSKCWCSTKPTACSTWASSTTSTPSRRRCPRQRQTLMFSATFAGPVGHAGARSSRATRSASRSARTPTRTARSSSACTGPTTRTHKHALLEQLLAEREWTRRSSSPARSATPTSSPTAWPRSAMRRRRCTAACRKAGATACCTALRQRQLRVLVATDVAARGIDVPTHHARHQLRLADEGRGLRAPHRPHRPRRPHRPGDHAGRAARRRR